MRRYLREFLSDRRVVETHPLLWRPILETMVLGFRPRPVARKYASIWLEDGSPLLVHTRAQRDAVAEAVGDAAVVRYAMRYGAESVGAVLDELRAAGHTRVLVVPLYPQYSASTIGTVVDEVYRHGLRSRDQFELRTVRSYATDPGYIEALAVAIESSWEVNGRPDLAGSDRLILSFHSIPRAMADAGDPYPAECAATADALAERLGIPACGMLVTFQSVFGPAAWIGPATIDTMADLGRGGTGRVDVVCPGFVSDCLETLEEIDMLNRETYLGAGGEQFHYIPWGNGSRAWTDALTEVVRGHLW